MWRTLAFVAALSSLGAFTQAQAERIDSASLDRSQELQKKHQRYVDALTRRGKLSTYQQLLGASKAPASSKFSAAKADAYSRDAAFYLAALGFTASDVRTFRGRKIELPNIAYRLFVDTDTTPAEQMLMADNIVIAQAGEVQTGRNRVDGFLSEMPFTVLRSLKGSRSTGDVVRVPRNSGLRSNGIEQKDYADIEFVPTKKYLLVLSENWYQQYVAAQNKQAEPTFTAQPFLAYEVLDDGTLTAGPRGTASGAHPKDVKSVERELKIISGSANKQRGGHER